MTYVLRLADDDTRALVVASLRAAADQRTRVARGAAGKVAEDKRAGRDVRAQAVKVTVLLAEADTLARVADQLAAAEDLPIVEHTVTDTLEALAGVPDALAALEAGDDGTSAAAQHLAALAGLTPADPDAVEDPETGALPEDNPTTVEEVLKP